MKVLIVNNYHHADKVTELVQAVGMFCLYEVVAYHEVGNNFRIESDIGAVIISGSEARIVKIEDRVGFDGVSRLIRNTNLPTLGICYGHQLMCLELGAEVATLQEPVIDIFESVRLIGADGIFHGFSVGQDISLAEAHYDYVKRESLWKVGLVLLADSPSCEVEAVKHKDKPFYGIQFHPEKIRIGREQCEEGLRIIKNFCSLSRIYQNPNHEN